MLHKRCISCTDLTNFRVSVKIPFPPLLGFCYPCIGDGVVVRPVIELSLLNQFVVDEHVEVRVEPAVVNLGLVIYLDFFLDFLSRRLVASSINLR